MMNAFVSSRPPNVVVAEALLQEVYLHICI